MTTTSVGVYRFLFMGLTFDDVVENAASTDTPTEVVVIP